MSRRQAILWLAFGAVLFSTSGLFIKLNTMPPLAIHSGRMLVASVTILFFLKRPTLPKTGYEIAGIFAIIAVQLLFILAVRSTTAANAIFIQFTAPIYVAVIAYFYLGERMLRPDWIAMGAILVGLFVFFSENLSLQGNLGNIYALFSGICLAWMIVLLRRAKDSNPLNFMFWGNLVGGVTALPFLFTPETLEPANIATVLFLGIFQIGLGFVIVSRVVPYLTSIEVILVQTIEPLVNPIWVFLVLGEIPTLQAFIGIAIVFTAVMWRGFQNTTPEPTPVPSQIETQ